MINVTNTDIECPLHFCPVCSGMSASQKATLLLCRLVEGLCTGQFGFRWFRRNGAPSRRKRKLVGTLGIDFKPQPGQTRANVLERTAGLLEELEHQIYSKDVLFKRVSGN